MNITLPRTLHRLPFGGDAARAGDDTVAQLDLFRRCTKAELATVERLAADMVVEAGAVLAREGAAAQQFVVVVSGRVVLEQGGQRVGTLTAGGHLGEGALLTDGLHTVTATAETDARVLVFGVREFADLIMSVPPVGRVLLEVNSRLLRQAQEQAAA